MFKKDLKFKILVVLTIAFLAYILVNKQFQNDTFYTIKVGESILKNGIDMKDHFSFIGNLAYTYPHWLYDVLVFLLYNIAGFPGLYLSSIVLATILLATMYFTCNKITKDKYISYLIMFFTGCFLFNFITTRAQSVTYILLLLLLYSIERLLEKGTKKYIIYIFILSLLIANVHAAIWPFVFVLFLPYFVSHLIAKIKIKNDILVIKEEKNIKKLSLAFILALLTGFLTPNFLIPFTYLIKTNLGISTHFIAEHQPVTIKMNIFVYIYSLLFFLTLLIKDMKIKLSNLFLVLGLLVLAFLSRRNFSLLMILSIFPIARIVKTFLSTRPKITIKPYLNNNIIYASLIIVFLLGGIMNFLVNRDKVYIREDLYPVSMTNYIKRELDYSNIRLYNYYDFGSYLLFNDIKVLIDSRVDLYLREFNDTTIFEDTKKIFEDYEEIFEKYNISHVAIYKKDKLTKLLELDKNYNAIYEDKYFILFEREVKV